MVEHLKLMTGVDRNFCFISKVMASGQIFVRIVKALYDQDPNEEKPSKHFQHGCTALGVSQCNYIWLHFVM